MGFYGNISNINTTQFSFDKIYANRKSMDQSRTTDNVYLGRYVLIEYDDDGLNGMKRIWARSDDEYYFGSDGSNKLTVKNTVVGEVFYRAVTENGKDGDFLTEEEIRTARHIFYKCTHNQNKVELIQITDSSSQTQYTTNYNIDIATYGEGRGYDSTVWQKVYADNVEKYVMIAELNSVIPTFDIAADAPTMNPIAPHFDVESTNVYYKLHVQAPWGFRVAEAEAGKSDTTTQWTTTTYNPSTGKNDVSKPETKNAAIYYNADAFEAFGKDGTIVKHDTTTVNEIKVVPVSSEQAIYDDHDITTKDLVSAPDIQELTINLPAIGNMMSDAWDVIHGDDRKDSTGDDHPSLQGRLNAFSAMQDNTIAIKRSSDGTLVGTKINGNTSRTVTDVLNEELHIYDYDQDDAWIKTSINTVGLDNKTDLNGIAIHHTFHKVSDTTSTSNKNTDEVASSNNSDKINLYTPIVDKAGHVVGKNTETVTLPYGFKTITVGSESKNIDGVAAVKGNVVADNTQDTLTLTPGNKWIHMSIDGASDDTIIISHEVNSTTSDEATTNWTQTEANTTIPVVTYEYDKAGHYTKHHTENYKLPFGYGQIKGDNNSSTAATATYDELSIVAGDDWLTSTVSTDAVTLTHDFTAAEDTTSSTNKNTVTENKDTIALYTPIVDAKGHVVGKNTETITLPYGYKTFTGDNNVSTSADSTQDTMSVTGDDWVQTTVSNDSIAFAHIGPVSGTVAEVDSETPAFGATFTIADHYFDATGHKFTSKSHTVKIPEPSLTNGTGNVVTGLNLVPSTGALTETKNNISNLLLTDYSKKANNADIADTDALGDALSKLQTQIHDTKTAINNLDYSETADSTKIITQITQVDGKITDVARAAAGTLVPGAATDNGLVNTTDSLNTIFNNIDKALNNLKSEKGAKNGVATLDENGLVPASQLPSFVDDVIEVNTYNALPTTGEAGKIYIVLGNNSEVENDDHAGKTYRWGGSAYAEISASIALGETTGTAYEGSKGKQLADKLANIEENAEVNVVNAVSTEFEINEDTRKLSVKEIPADKVTGLTGENSIESRLEYVEQEVTSLDSLAFENRVTEELLDQTLKDKYNRKISEIDAAIIGINQEAKRLTNENIEIVNNLNQEIQERQVKDSDIESLIREEITNRATITNKLNSAAYREEEYFVSKTQYDLEIQTRDAQINGLNFEAKRLTNEIKALTDLVNELQKQIAALTTQNNNTTE